MADEIKTAVAVEEHHEAAAVDALAHAAETAQVAAGAAVASATQVASHAQAVAAEHVELIAEETSKELAAQEDQLSWLKDHARQTGERLELQASALTQIAERQAASDATLARMLELLTPKASPETTAVVPEELAKKEATKESPEAPAQEPVQARKKHRWI